MSDRIVGTCSRCKGAVTVPDVWHGVNPPTPSCSSCGGRPKSSFGPIIEIAPSSGPQLLTETQL